jgi:hypothetical protein
MRDERPAEQAERIRNQGCAPVQTSGSTEKPIAADRSKISEQESEPTGATDLHRDPLSIINDKPRCPSQIDPSLDLMAFVKSDLLPVEYEAFCTLRRTLDFRLSCAFLDTLSEVERKAFSAETVSAVSYKWDDTIIEAAGRYGPILLVSDRVLQTIHRWRTGTRESGPDLSKLEKFFAAILEEAKVRWGEAKSPITLQHARFKPDAVADLTKLQGELRKSTLRTAEEVIELSRRLITVQEYPALSQNRTALFVFFRFNPQITLEFGTVGDRTRGEKRTSPTDLFYHLVAFETNRTFESVRQEISRINSEDQRGQ